MDPEDLSFKFLREITDGFSEERRLGEGAFGVVYRGVIKNGENVAVKMLKIQGPDVDSKQFQFQNELYNLKMLSHPNIVQVFGYCHETEKIPYSMSHGSKMFVEDMHMALCLEYLQNGSLHTYLYDEFCEPKLEWHTCFKIIKGTCEGLKYIHKDLKEPMYHLDLKPDNILLDKDMLPKIADFGLSRIFAEGRTRTTSRPYGTLGYQPPEYIEKGEISEKYDIFSLGIIMIRILSGRKSYPKCLDMLPDEFIDQVHKNWRKRLQATGSIDSLIEAYCHQVMTCTRIALSCLENDKLKRPDIVNITDKLNKTEAHIGKLTMKEMREPQDVKGSQQSISMSSNSISELEPLDTRERSSDVVEELIVGRTEEKDKIISLLQVMSENILILPIHGIGGIGKTTFARLIYNDPKFKHYTHAWVDVPQSFDMDKITDSIIKQISEKESQDNGRQMVHRSLKELLPGKKIMIVLDDLWEENQFKLNKLKDELYNNSSNIITLVTTRSERVADRICRNLQPYKILPLTNDMCWDIIKHRSSFESRHDKEQLACIGHEIAKKCDGVALAALSLGFTLRDMKNFDQWMKVKDNEIWNEPTSNDSLPNQVVASLMLSYRYLEPSLKPCFTYCAVFPKGHEIVRKDLVYQWISLGFIKPNNVLSDLQLCEKYIERLLGLSFLQVSPKPSKLEYSEKDASFTMHDLVHDLAISLVGDKLLDKTKKGNTTGLSRHCQYALLGDCSMPLQSTVAAPFIIRKKRKKVAACIAQLIALRFQDCRRTQVSDDAFAPATSLRVLDLSECSIHNLPDSIGELKKLRYLSAPGVRGRMSLECITKLSHLIYLNLEGSSAISALPESIADMKDLMHLNLSGCKSLRLLPNSFTRLKKLVHLDFSSCHLITFGESELLGRLSQLEHLSLSTCKIKGDLAKALCGITELRYLDLSHVSCSGNLCTGLQQVLVRFTKLRFLKMHGFLNKSRVDQTETENFIKAISSLSSLEYLNLAWNRNLCNIPESIGKLSQLHTLDLSHCVNLKRLPAAISGIHNMKSVHVEGCDGLAKSTLPLLKNVETVIPHFVVHAGDSGSNSDLYLLEKENPTELEISGLENVKSATEAQKIKLLEKQRIKKLGLVWTRDTKRFVDDEDVLKQLVPPHTIEEMRLQGYNRARFPSWITEIATGLPYLLDITLEDMPNCSSLPPFGLLPNLKKLRIGRMDSIRKIGRDLYGDGGIKKCVFPELRSFKLQEMKCLEEWNTSYSYPSASGEDGSNDKELAFPNLQEFIIADCPMLRFKSLSPLAEQTEPLALCKKIDIIRSSQVISSSWECRGQFDASSSAATTSLCIVGCEAPLHQWSLLRHLPSVKDLVIEDCSDLTCSSTDLLRCLPSLKALNVRDCKSVAALPEWLGDLTSLEKIQISNCEGIKTLPLSIQQLTRLQDLKVNGCPQLVQLRWPPSLKTLSINNCKSIVQLPQRLGEISSLEELQISNCEGIKSLTESIQQLTTLQCLKINCCPELVQFRCPRSLEDLCLQDCKSIVELPERLGDLTSLKKLEISNCEGVKALPESIQQLTRLQWLKISCCPQLVQFRCPPSLEDLCFQDCKSFVELPERLGDLTSLKKLEISNCEGVKALPDSIQQLTCLQWLKIFGSPKLVQWCISEENKMKLAHIKIRIYQMVGVKE